MSRDFFEQLTDPRRDPADPRPSSALEQQLAAELAPVLELLQRGAPPNGIDLSGRWRNYLAEQASAAPVAARPRRRWSHSWLHHGARYAAVLVLGVLMGGVGVRFHSAETLSGGLSVGLPAGATAGRCEYSSEQRQLMFAVLQPASDATQVRRASIELAACVSCHESALRGRLAGMLP